MTATQPCECPACLRRDVPLGPKTTFGVGGTADLFFSPAGLDELRACVRWCRQAGVARYILGGGSNLLVADAGIRGAVIQLDPAGFSRIEIDDEVVRVGAAAPLPRVLRRVCVAGLSGMEALVGIPAWMGGAVRMNAGGRHGEIARCITRVRMVDGEGDAEWRRREDIDFGYRRAGLGEAIVVEVELTLCRAPAADVARAMRRILHARRQSQPLRDRSAGCVFRNPPGASAGALIDRAGLKGARIGGAMVSPRHANFIVAEAGATAEDIRALIGRVRSIVREQTGVELEAEVELWPRET